MKNLIIIWFTLLSFFFASVVIFSSCGDNVDPAKSREYLAVNQLNLKGNLSTYNYHKDIVNEGLFTLDVGGGCYFSSGAYLNGNFLYALTICGQPKIRKIDTQTGIEVLEKNSYAYYRSIIDFHNQNIVIGNVEPFYDGSHTYDLLIIRFYDTNLSLVDSVAVDGVYGGGGMGALKIVGDKLFCGVQRLSDAKYFIKVMDLNTKTYLSDLAISNKASELVLIKGNNLLCSHWSTSYSIINTQALTVGSPINVNGFGDSPVYSERENVIYFLRALAQPSIVAYALGKLDLSNNTTYYVATNPADITAGISAPILYDKDLNIVVDGNFRIFSPKDGSVIRTPAFTQSIYSPSRIFIIR